MQPKNLVLTSLVVAGLAGCGGGSSPSTAAATDSDQTVTVAAAAPNSSVVFEPVTVSSCDKSSYALLALGDYALTTNLWGKGKIADFTECVSGASVGTVRSNVAVQTGVNAQFSWSWPDGSNSDIKAYPEILYRPGGQGLASIPFTEVAGLTVNHDVSISATGDYNVAYDIWVDSTATTDHWPHKAEIMIKLQQTWSDAPVIDTITVDGNRYDVFEHSASSEFSQWDVLVFASKTPLLKASIPLKPFIDYLVSNNRLLRTDYISTVEFGTELKRGSGTATINSYSVTR